MAQGSSFWKWYAHVNDDMRHHLVDRAWFGQNARDNAFERDVQGMAERNEANAGNVRDVMHEFYGRHDHGGPAASSPHQNDKAVEEFYRGPDTEQDR